MAKIKPFKGVRPPKEFIEEVASRPYDVLNSQEARAEAEGNGKSISQKGRMSMIRLFT